MDKPLHVLTQEGFSYHESILPPVSQLTHSRATEFTDPEVAKSYFDPEARLLAMIGAEGIADLKRQQRDNINFKQISKMGLHDRLYAAEIAGLSISAEGFADFLFGKKPGLPKAVVTDYEEARAYWENAKQAAPSQCRALIPLLEDGLAASRVKLFQSIPTVSEDAPAKLEDLIVGYIKMVKDFDKYFLYSYMRDGNIVNDIFVLHTAFNDLAREVGLDKHPQDVEKIKAFKDAMREDSAIVRCLSGIVPGGKVKPRFAETLAQDVRKETKGGYSSDPTHFENMVTGAGSIVDDMVDRLAAMTTLPEKVADDLLGYLFTSLNKARKEYIEPSVASIKAMRVVYWNLCAYIIKLFSPAKELVVSKEEFADIFHGIFDKMFYGDRASVQIYEDVLNNIKKRDPRFVAFGGLLDAGLINNLGNIKDFIKRLDVGVSELEVQQSVELFAKGMSPEHVSPWILASYNPSSPMGKLVATYINLVDYLHRSGVITGVNQEKPVVSPEVARNIEAHEFVKTLKAKGLNNNDPEKFTECMASYKPDVEWTPGMIESKFSHPETQFKALHEAYVKHGEMNCPEFVFGMSQDEDLQAALTVIGKWLTWFRTLLVFEANREFTRIGKTHYHAKLNLLRKVVAQVDRRTLSTESFDQNDPVVSESQEMLLLLSTEELVMSKEGVIDWLKARRDRIAQMFKRKKEEKAKEEKMEERSQRLNSEIDAYREGATGDVSKILDIFDKREFLKNLKVIGSLGSVETEVNEYLGFLEKKRGTHPDALKYNRKFHPMVYSKAGDAIYRDLEAMKKDKREPIDNPYGTYEDLDKAKSFDEVAKIVKEIETVCKSYKSFPDKYEILTPTPKPETAQVVEKRLVTFSRDLLARVQALQEEFWIDSQAAGWCNGTIGNLEWEWYDDLSDEQQERITEDFETITDQYANWMRDMDEIFDDATDLLEDWFSLEHKAANMVLAVLKHLKSN